MKTILFMCLAVICCQCALATEYSFGKGKLVVKKLATNAVRIQYVENKAQEELPDWLYVKNEEVKSNDISVRVDAAKQQVEVLDKSGKVVFTATEHQLKSNTVAGLQTYEARLAFASPEGEFLYGLGQFQDGYTNVRGLSRRLTQVNTQIAIPMMLSSRGYGILWNNYGLTDFNPMDSKVEMTKGGDVGSTEVVNVTSTEGGKQEVRRSNQFAATINVAEAGDYSLLLDVGQKMARRHNLVIDGKTVIELQNTWLPPTASTIVHLSQGSHTLSAELSNGDKPVVYYGKVKNETVFRSPVAQTVDYTVFVGNADDIIASYRKLTGDSPLMPQWALGYIHCRERFHSQDEIINTAKRFRSENLPADVMVQDWQYWGKYGWNAMQFDEANYPNPKQLTDELHAMNM
ncbi:MAG: glycosyl hydrolase family 31, partial [Bacteroidaceae bacterium]|nr:glycosyl hydrolase family 31 [Bacteroidaceae bacterium]